MAGAKLQPKVWEGGEEGKDLPACSSARKKRRVSISPISSIRSEALGEEKDKRNAGLAEEKRKELFFIVQRQKEDQVSLRPDGCESEAEEKERNEILEKGERIFPSSTLRKGGKERKRFTSGALF